MSGETKVIAALGEWQPPSANGELLFAEPWEGRVFGMVHALCDRGVLGWDEFRDVLIAEIQAAEARANEGVEAFHYYRCFAQALEQLVTGRQLLTQSEWDRLIAELSERTEGHDH